METNLDERWREAFRHHRHDVLNGLQLVSGYLQFGRPRRAADALERIVSWMRTLAWVQSLTEVIGGSHWLWSASTCPNVLLLDQPQVAAINAQLDVHLSEAWRWLQESATTKGWREIGIILMGQPVVDGALQNVTVAISHTDEIGAWWPTAEPPKSDQIAWTLLNRK